MMQGIVNDMEREKFVKLLSQPDMSTFTITILLFISQVCIASTIQNVSFGFWFKVIVFGAPISHGLYLMCLEFASNLCFGYEILDRFSGIFCNFGTGFPYSEFLRFFESEHRAFHNSTSHIDPHKPTPSEITLVRGVGLKILYLFIYPFLLARRLVFRNHSFRYNTHMSNFLIWNIVLQILVNFFVWYWLGIPALLYIWASSYFASAPIHPIATHILLQHIRINKKLKLAHVYSYYGPMNVLVFNSGFHREKHLHPKVPWFRLPLIRQLYFHQEGAKTNISYQSILQSLHDFIFDQNATLENH